MENDLYTAFIYRVFFDEAVTFPTSAKAESPTTPPLTAVVGEVSAPASHRRLRLSTIGLQFALPG